MPRTCTICTSKKRAAIEAALVADAPYRDIARRYNVGRDSLKRHVDAGHIQASVHDAQEAKDEARALDVARQLHVVNTVTLQVMHSALGDRKTHHLVLQAVDRVLRQLELQDKRNEMGDLAKEVEALKALFAVQEQEESEEQ